MPDTETGFQVPDLSLGTTGGSEINLSKIKRGLLVVYFYPKDDTPGCTLEGKEFTALHEQIKSAGGEVFGISRDSLKSHEKFKKKYNYSFELISDPEGKLHRAFGVLKQKILYGKSVRGTERSTFIISEGKLVREWRNVKAPGHARAVLDFLKTLGKHS